MAGSEIVVVTSPAEKDWRGDPTVDGDVPTSREYRRCSIWPRTSTEDSSEGEVIIDGLNVWIPARQKIPLAISALDTVHARGKDWAVHGQPGEYRKRRQLGLMVVLKRRGT